MEQYQEEWKDIIGYENIYQISNMGFIKSIARKVNTATGFRITKEKILKHRLDKDGYCLVNLTNNNKSTTHKIHRLVAFYFIPNPDNKPEVNHLKGNKLDNRYFMLEWNTAKENCFHKNNSLDKLSERWKLTSLDIYIIRKHYNLNPSINKQIFLNLFSISRPHLHKILTNKVWIDQTQN